VESLNVSWRCGFNEKARHIRCTVLIDRPQSRTMPRELQCVAPSGWLSSVRVTTASIRSSSILRGANPARRPRPRFVAQTFDMLRTERRLSLDFAHHGPVRSITRLRLDACLFDPPAAYKRRGRHPKKSARQPSTARLNGLNLEAYLKEALTKIAEGHTINRIDELMPWRMTPMAQPQPP